MRSVNSGEDFGVALFEVGASISLTEDAELAPDVPQLISPPAIQAQPLVGQQLHGNLEASQSKSSTEHRQNHKGREVRK